MGRRVGSDRYRGELVVVRLEEEELGGDDGAECYLLVL